MHLTWTVKTVKTQLYVGGKSEMLTKQLAGTAHADMWDKEQTKEYGRQKAGNRSKMS